MNKTTVVNIRRGEAYDIRIMRPSIWGNPFPVVGSFTREDAVEFHRIWLPYQPHLMELIPTLRGKRLGCCCAPLPCHGDNIARLANCPKCEGSGWIGDGLAVVQCGCRIQK